MNFVLSDVRVEIIFAVIDIVEPVCLTVSGRPHIVLTLTCKLQIVSHYSPVSD